MTTQTLVTAEELLRLSAEGGRYELVAGELRTMSPSGGEHRGIAATFTTYLNMHVRAQRLGWVFAAETGFLVTTDPDTVLAPDVAFVRAERLGVASNGFHRGAPDLAVEIVSPHDRYIEVAEKVASWLGYGTRMVVVVNPRRRSLAVHRSAVAVWHLTVEDRLDGEDVVPGWSLAVRDLFDAL